MIDGPYFLGRAAFIAHAVREIRARLPDAFVPTDDHLNYAQRLKSLREQWDPVRSALNAADSPAATVELPVGVGREISDLLDRDAEIPGRVKARFLRMCALVAGEAVHWAGNERLAQQWNKIQVQRIAHSGDEPEADARAIAAFREQESIIFKVFEYAAEREARIVDLAAATTPDTIAVDVLELVTLHDKDVFFSRLTDPALFGPLNTLGELVSNHDLHFWPQDHYIRRMATSIPADVEALLRRLPPTTPGVTRAMLEIALSLPDELFVNVMTRSKWLQADPSRWSLDPVLAAMRRLAALGAIGPLEARARKLLEVRAEVSKWSEITGERMTAVPALDSADFGGVVDTIAELLCNVDPMRAIDFFRLRLDHVIGIEGYTYDHHGFWSSNLLDLDERRIDVKGQLTGALAALALRVGAHATAEVAEYFDRLTVNASLYRRIADAVIATHGTLSAAAARIADQDRWTYGPEGRALLERGFPLLSGAAQEELLHALFARQRQRAQMHLGEANATNEEIERLAAHTAGVILGATACARSEPYRSWLAAAATPHDDGAVEEASITLPALERLGVADVGAALAPWVPSEQSCLPGPYGLGASLKQHVQQNGNLWLAQPEMFATVPSYFLGWALNGLDMYLRSQLLAHPAGIAIASAALARAEQLAKSASAQDRDSAAHIAQNAATLLLEQTKKATTSDEVDQSLAAAQVLRLLPRYERFGSHSPWRASSDGLNDPPTLAIHVIGHLSLVVHNNKLEAGRVHDAFDLVAVTADHLQRAALGQFFRWVAVIFPTDAQRWAEAIFFGPDADANRAAWAGYILWSEPHRDTHQILRPAYFARLDDLAAFGDDAHNVADPFESIADRTLWHVWVFFANDVEPLDDSHSLMEHVLRIVDDAHLDRMLRKIASSLRRETGPAQERVFARAISLWDRVAEQIVAGTRTSLACSGVAAWLAAPLPASWRFARAEALAVSDVAVRRDAWLIIQAAVELRQEHLRGALEMVERMLQPPNSDILTAVQQFGAELLNDGAAGDPDERHLARRIDGYLVSNHRPSLLRTPFTE